DPGRLLRLATAVFTAWRRDRVVGVKSALAAEIVGRPITSASEYRAWCGRYDTVTAHDRQEMRHQSETLTSRARISLLMVLNSGSEPLLGRTIESVIRQPYPYWELIVADADAPVAVRKLLDDYRNRDSRVLGATSGAVGCYADALALAGGDVVGILDEG